MHLLRFPGPREQIAANMIGALTKQPLNVLKVTPGEIEEGFRRAESEVKDQGLQVSESIKLLRAVLASMKRAFICIDALMNFRINIYPSF